MRGRLFLPICSFSMRISQGFFFSIPTVGLSNKKSKQVSQKPNQSDNTCRNTDLSLWSFPINWSKIPSSPKGRTWRYFLVEQQDLPALPEPCPSPWGFQNPIPEAEVQQLLPRQELEFLCESRSPRPRLFHKIYQPKPNS